VTHKRIKKEITMNSTASNKQNKLIQSHTSNMVSVTDTQSNFKKHVDHNDSDD